INRTISPLLLILAPLYTQAEPITNHIDTTYLGSQIDPNSSKGLTENDVFDIDPDREITEEDIQFAIEYSRKNVSLKEGDAIILVQSGKQFPDIELQDILQHYFQLSTYPGFAQGAKQRIARRNENNTVKKNSYIKILRFIAAKSRQNNIVILWDALEAGLSRGDEFDIKW